MPDGLPLMFDPVSVTPAHFQRFQRVFPGFTHRKCYYYHKLRNHRMVSGANFSIDDYASRRSFWPTTN